MPNQVSESQTISDRAATLLSRAEGIDVEFKKSFADIENEDLVAFANSDDGGAILIGVEEYTDEQGKQRGRIVGCSVDDSAKRSILDRALQCYPPISVQVTLENLSDTPFMRLEIPASSNRPHCTSGGTYKIRGDGRNEPLIPRRALEMFLDSEADQFVQRFETATSSLEERLRIVASTIARFEDQLAETYASTFGAENSSVETATMASIVMDIVEDSAASLSMVHAKIDALLKGLDLENPEHALRMRQLEELERILAEKLDEEGAA